MAEQVEKTGQCALCTLAEKGLMAQGEEVVFFQAASYRGGLKGHPGESKKSGFAFVLSGAFAFYDREVTCRMVYGQVLSAELRHFQPSGIRAVLAAGAVGRQLQEVKNYVAVTFADDQGTERTASFQIHGALSIPGEEIKATEFLNHLLDYKGSFGSKGSTGDPSVALKKLSDLKQAGMISEQEFDEKRRQILNRI